MTKQAQYRVGPKGGICLGPKSTYFGPNVVIPPEMLDDNSRTRLLKERAIVEIGKPVAPAPKEPTPPPVGMGTRTFENSRSESVGEVPSQASGDGAAAQARAQLAQIEADRAAGLVKPVEAATSVEIVREEPAPAPAPSATAGFTHDPDGLLGTSADDLRKLVLDIDPTMEVNHLDEVELIAVLSSEYVAPAQA